MTLNSIFDKDDLSETAVDTEQEPAMIITTDSPEEPEKASVPPPSKKRGRPRKQTNVPEQPITADYKFLIDHALKQKNPSANVVITSHMCLKKSKQTKCSKGNPSDDGGHDSVDGDSEQSDGSDSDNQPVKKKSKKEKKAKGFVETPLNKNINAKIQNLQNRW
ncbi:hypothetical protein BU15DRAFT_63137, partial [Melanogaster broomeanus]